MKPIKSRITRGLTLKSVLNCIDNSGAKKLSIITRKGYKGVRGRIPKAGVGDVVVCSVVKGNEKTRHKVVYAVIVRQTKEYRRADGLRVKFEDNAAVLVNPKTFDPQGTEIRGVVAREAIERFTTIGKISSQVF
jgi:large subunit ribosomal protein L14